MQQNQIGFLVAGNYDNRSILQKNELFEILILSQLTPENFMAISYAYPFIPYLILSTAVIIPLIIIYYRRIKPKYGLSTDVYPIHKED